MQFKGPIRKRWRREATRPRRRRRVVSLDALEQLRQDTATPPSLADVLAELFEVERTKDEGS